MEFVILYEFNYNTREPFFFYLQWTGNEEALTKLHKMVSKGSYDYASQFSLNIDTKIPLEAVDIHCKASNLFTKCTGKFTFPFYDDDHELDELEIARLINSRLGGSSSRWVGYKNTKY